jgi:hypothetical protein
MKRTLIIIAAVLLLIGIGVGVYSIFFHKTALLSPGQGTGFPSADGSGVAPAPAPATQELGVPLPGAGTDVAPRLVRISDKPVALGAVAVYVPGTKAVIIATSSKATTTTPAAAFGTDPDVRVQYVERESGNIYAYQAHGRALTRLSNKTLPGVQEAMWLTDGSLAYVRFLEKVGDSERVNTYALAATTTGGYFLEPDLAQVLTKGTSTLVTLLSTADGSSATVSTPSGTNVRTLFATVLSSIRLAFLGTNYLVTTKGSAKADGYAFTVDSGSGTLTRALGPLQGLSTLPSPSGQYVLYSYLDRGKLGLAVLNITTHVATRLPLVTLPEKCVWTGDSVSLYCGVPTTLTGTLPDDWYQGAVSFSDRLWKIDISGRVASLIIDPKAAGKVDIDMVGLALDRTNDVLVFTNKQDETLYAYDL